MKEKTYSQFFVETIEDMRTTEKVRHLTYGMSIKLSELIDIAKYLQCRLNGIYIKETNITKIRSLIDEIEAMEMEFFKLQKK